MIPLQFCSNFCSKFYFETNFYRVNQIECPVRAFEDLRLQKYLTIAVYLAK